MNIMREFWRYSQKFMYAKYFRKEKVVRFHLFKILFIFIISHNKQIKKL